MKFNKPLELLFSAPSNVSVLRVLNERNAGISGREAARLTGLSLRTVQVALSNLESTGIVKRFAGNREHLFVINRKNFFSAKLAEKIFDAEAEFRSGILSTIKKAFIKDVESIILFGSAARGNDSVNSDLDVCLIYKRDKKILEEKASLVRTKLYEVYGVTFAPVYFNIGKFREMAVKKENPVKEILKEGRVVYGKSTVRILNG
ncbi:MAG: nucleotidyltransferase domain-containing protein [Ignavibacteriales bacterium]|nr:MAG: nucleotidyltransferase domain-containing protein [Ignavibacteriales bacterium]